MSKRDLFVVVADLDAENAITTLLCQRQPALGIQLDFNPDRPPNGDLLRYSGRDSGCYKDAADLLRPPQQTHRHGLLCFDRHGSGAESRARERVEAEVEDRLVASGWPRGHVAAVVLDPELEAWVWSSSPHVAELLGWGEDRQNLVPFLQAHGLWEPDCPKPQDPKAAMEQALRSKRKPRGARLFAELASRVTLQGCQDPAFQKLQQTLASWFPAPNAQESQ